VVVPIGLVVVPIGLVVVPSASPRVPVPDTSSPPAVLYRTGPQRARGVQEAACRRGGRCRTRSSCTCQAGACLQLMRDVARLQQHRMDLRVF
jgi:hypothetical protein